MCVSRAGQKRFRTFKRGKKGYFRVFRYLPNFSSFLHPETLYFEVFSEGKRNLYLSLKDAFCIAFLAMQEFSQKCFV